MQEAFDTFRRCTQREPVAQHWGSSRSRTAATPATAPPAPAPAPAPPAPSASTLQSQPVPVPTADHGAASRPAPAVPRDGVSQSSASAPPAVTPVPPLKLPSRYRRTTAVVQEQERGTSPDGELVRDWRVSQDVLRTAVLSDAAPIQPGDIVADWAQAGATWGGRVRRLEELYPPLSAEVQAAAAAVERLASSSASSAQATLRETQSTKQKIAAAAVTSTTELRLQELQERCDTAAVVVAAAGEWQGTLQQSLGAHMEAARRRMAQAQRLCDEEEEDLQGVLQRTTGLFEKQFETAAELARGTTLTERTEEAMAVNHRLAFQKTSSQGALATTVEQLDALQRKAKKASDDAVAKERGLRAKKDAVQRITAEREVRGDALADELRDLLRREEDLTSSVSSLRDAFVAREAAALEAWTPRPQNAAPGSTTAAQAEGASRRNAAAVAAVRKAREETARWAHTVLDLMPPRTEGDSAQPGPLPPPVGLTPGVPAALPAFLQEPPVPLERWGPLMAERQCWALLRSIADAADAAAEGPIQERIDAAVTAAAAAVSPSSAPFVQLVVDATQRFAHPCHGCPVVAATAAVLGGQLPLCFGETAAAFLERIIHDAKPEGGAVIATAAITNAASKVYAASAYGNGAAVQFRAALVFDAATTAAGVTVGRLWDIGDDDAQGSTLRTVVRHQAAVLLSTYAQLEAMLWPIAQLGPEGAEEKATVAEWAVRGAWDRPVLWPPAFAAELRKTEPPKATLNGRALCDGVLLPLRAKGDDGDACFDVVRVAAALRQVPLKIHPV